MDDGPISAFAKALREVQAAAFHRGCPMVVKEINVDPSGAVILGFKREGAPDHEPLTDTEIYVP